MKATIEGTRYNTDIATKIGTGRSSQTKKESPEFWTATLYQRPNALDYFIAGKGNSMSIFRGSERIIPMSTASAKIWASWFLSTSEYNSHFGAKR